MKKYIFLGALLFGAMTQANAQVVGDKDISEDYSHKYMEVVMTVGKRSTVMAAYGDSKRQWLMKDGSKAKFESAAQMFDYIEGFGWKYVDVIDHPTINNSMNTTFLFKRRKKKEAKK